MNYLPITLWTLAIYGSMFVSLRAVGVPAKFALMIATALLTGMALGAFEILLIVKGILQHD